MSRVIRATISGPHAHAGEIAASDVARLILALEKALARAAYVALGRERPAETGRHAGAIEKATKLRFVGIDKGSFVELLALPDVGEPSEDTFPFTVAALGEAAFDQLLFALRADSAAVDRKLAEAVADLADQLGVGDRNDSVRLEPQDRNRNPGVIDQAVRVRMRAISDRETPGSANDNSVAGRLVEADFEKRTARLQPQHGPSVTVTFTDDLDDDIHRALRQVATLEGLVTYDPKTRTAKRVELRRLVQAEQVLATVGVHGAFGDHRSVADLQREQGVPAVASADSLRAIGLTDEDRMELAALLVE